MLQWVVVSEIFPLKSRAKSVSLATSSNWCFNAAIAYGTPYLMGEGGAGGGLDLGPKIFFLWGAFCAAAVVFVYFLVLETSCHTLEAIDELYERIPFGKAWESVGFEPSWSFRQIIELGYADSGFPPHELQETTTTSTTQSSQTGTTGTSTTSDPKITMGNVDFSY